MLVELGDPAIGEGRVLAGRIPAEPRGQAVSRITGRRRSEIALKVAPGGAWISTVAST